MTFPRITTLFYVNRQQSEKLFKKLSKIISTSFYKAKDYAESTRGRPIGRPLCYWVQLNAQSFKTYYDRLVTLCMELHPDLIAIIAGQFKQHHRLRIHTF